MSAFGMDYFCDSSPTTTAIVDPSGKRLSRREFRDQVLRLSNALIGYGLQSGDVMAIISPNCAEYLVAYFAGIRVGLSVVPVNWHLPSAEIQYVLGDAGAKCVVVHSRLPSRKLFAIRNASPNLVLAISIGPLPGAIDMEGLLKNGSEYEPETRPLGRVLAYSSATTGRPKGIVLPKRNARAALAKIVDWHKSLGIELDSGNVHLCSSMLYHSAPLEGAVIALEMGHTLALIDHWDPELFLRTVEHERVTTTFVVPSMFVRLLKLNEAVRRSFRVDSLRFVIHAGAPCPTSVKREMLNWWGNIIWESYGAAEVQGVVVGPEEWLRKPGTVGRPIPGSAVKILDDDGVELPANHVGHIYLKPHTGDMFEYKGDPEKTRRAYCNDYVTVGDLGYLDNDEYLFVCDRRADLIISSGMNIYPAEIEGHLIEHPLVIDCAVIGQTDELLGQVPVAFVEKRYSTYSERELALSILDFLSRRVSAMKCPRSVQFVDTIPRDPNGKLLRRLLR